MYDKWKYIGSSAMPLSLTIALAYATRQIPQAQPIARTLVMVSGSTFFSRIIYSLVNPNVDGWRNSKNRYASQVSVSTGVGLTTTLLGSAYDQTPLTKSGINVGVSTLGSWAVGNLIWFSDALVLGQRMPNQMILFRTFTFSEALRGMILWLGAWRLSLIHRSLHASHVHDSTS